MDSDPGLGLPFVERRIGERRTTDRRRGRPRLAEESEMLSGLVPVAMFDRLSKSARKHRENTSEALRRLLDFALTADERDSL